MFWKKKRDSLQAIYTMLVIDSFGFSLIGIFVPVFIFSETKRLEDVIFYFIAHNVFLLATILISIVLGKRFGLQALLVARLPFLFIYFLSLLTWETFHFSYFFIAVASGIQAALYWTPLNIIFARESKPKRMGRLVSKLMAYPQIAGIFGPLLGAFIIEEINFRALFGIAFLIIIFSVLPILKVDIKKIKYDLNLKKAWHLFRKYKRYMVAELFDNFGGEAEGIIWPMFIFLTSASFVSVGLIGALVPVGAIIFTLFVGQWVDKGNSKFLMKMGALSLLVLWLIRFISDDSLVFFATSIVAGFCLSLVLVPFTSKMTKIAKREVVDEFIIFREIFFFVGRMAFFLTVLLLLGNIKMLFPIAGLVYLYFVFL